jgi:transposase InsO family protein
MPTHVTPMPAPAENPAGLLANGWYTTEEFAGLLKVDPSTVRRWRTARPPQGPPFVKLSDRVVMYSAPDVERWLSDHRIDPAQAA